jgi:predicted nucleic acid-binding protein
VILVDTSVWIALMRGAVRIDWEEMEEFATCGPVLQEILQGMDDSEEAMEFRRGLGNIAVLGDPLPLDAFAAAAEIYRIGRSKGYTIRSSTDCLIAAIATRAGVAVWHRDRDYDNIARFTALKAMRHWRKY